MLLSGGALVGSTALERVSSDAPLCSLLKGHQGNALTTRAQEGMYLRPVSVLLTISQLTFAQVPWADFLSSRSQWARDPPGTGDRLLCFSK